MIDFLNSSSLNVLLFIAIFFFLFLSLEPIHFEIFIEPKWFSFVCKSLSFSWRFRSNDNHEIYTCYTFISINSPDVHFKLFHFKCILIAMNSNFCLVCWIHAKSLDQWKIILSFILCISSLIQSTFYAAKWHDAHVEKEKMNQQQKKIDARDRFFVYMLLYFAVTAFQIGANEPNESGSKRCEMCNCSALSHRFSVLTKNLW